MRNRASIVAADDAGGPERRPDEDDFASAMRGEEPSGSVVTSKRRVTRIGRNTAAAALVVVGAVSSAVAYNVLDDGGSGAGDSSGSVTVPRTLDELDAEYERGQNVLDVLDADLERSEPGGDGMVKDDANGCIVLPDRARAICPDTVSDEARERALRESDVAPVAPIPEPKLDDVDPVEIRRRGIKEPADVEPGKLPDISHPRRLS